MIILLVLVVSCFNVPLHLYIRAAWLITHAVSYTHLIEDMNAQRNETETSSEEEENEATSSLIDITSARKAHMKICPKRPKK